jgi:hypothetical protein
MVEKKYARRRPIFLRVAAESRRARGHICPIKAQLVAAQAPPCHFIGRVLDSLATDRKRPEQLP